MAKKRLNQYTREVLKDWMCKEKLDENEGQQELQALFDKLITLINPIIRKRYPEKDMIILRKYKLVKTDTCLTFHKIKDEIPVVFGIDFRWDYSKFSETAKASIADVPQFGGCNSSIVFEGTEELEKLFHTFKNTYDSFNKKRTNKYNKYHAFVNNCKYLEDIEEVIAVPENIRFEITGKATSLSIMSQDLVNEIKEDFKNV